MIQIKFDGGHYVEIYDTEHKILEKADGMLWNTDEENPIAVDKKRYENGGYVESDVPAELIEKEIAGEPEVVMEEDSETVVEETIEDEEQKEIPEVKIKI